MLKCIVICCGCSLIVWLIVLLITKKDKQKRNVLSELVYITSTTELVDGSKFIRIIAVSAQKASERYGKLQGILHPDKTLLLSDVIVNTPFRKKGIGSDLLTEFISFAKSNDVKEIYGNLSTVDDANITHAFYKKFGFEIKMLDEERDDNIYATIHKYF